MSGKDVKYFLSNAPLLERLAVIDSPNLVRLRVSGQSLALKYLEIMGCRKLRSVKFCEIEVLRMIDLHRVSNYCFDVLYADESSEDGGLGNLHFIIEEFPNLEKLVLHVGGSRGLMRSVEKFKLQAGCRFGTYAYWWIRQTIRKAIFQHSRTIRLPVMAKLLSNFSLWDFLLGLENVYTLIAKVLDARRLYIREGNHYPSKEDLAKRVAITVEKLEKLLFTTGMPLSMQQPVWADQDTTFQVIADPGIEITDASVAKQLMRHHVRNLLGILSQRERPIIALRFGIKDGKHKSLSGIGNLYGLSRERVRQESRALYNPFDYTTK
ncbi:hypothetical protein FNV43_RR21541 [Rhamnella rubrinervis]|uniref:Uncharacterized protein n=1 Tax=Rhamnella rubrinervis TaxID=2594499 RepID=A0A8K0GRJ2_9ROSA|nr:hypothetical protein FNV43_RR21541 [Rhamnella rubrinervis]